MIGIQHYLPPLLLPQFAKWVIRPEGSYCDPKKRFTSDIAGLDQSINTRKKKIN